MKISINVEEIEKGVYNIWTDDHEIEINSYYASNFIPEKYRVRDKDTVKFAIELKREFFSEDSILAILGIKKD